MFIRYYTYLKLNEISSTPQFYMTYYSLGLFKSLLGIIPGMSSRHWYWFVFLSSGDSISISSMQYKYYLHFIRKNNESQFLIETYFKVKYWRILSAITENKNLKKFVPHYASTTDGTCEITHHLQINQVSKGHLFKRVIPKDRVPVEDINKSDAQK